MDEIKARKLAEFRVGEDKPMGKAMNPEDTKLRREFIRTMLRSVAPWDKLTPDQLDNVRISKLGDSWFIEDTDFYEYQF